MKSNKLQIGIIGCGGIANQKHLPSLKANADKADMVAFCDLIEERALKAAKEYGVDGARVYTDYNRRSSRAHPECGSLSHHRGCLRCRQACDV